MLFGVIFACVLCRVLAAFLVALNYIASLYQAIRERQEYLANKTKRQPTEDATVVHYRLPSAKKNREAAKDPERRSIFDNWEPIPLGQPYKVQSIALSSSDSCDGSVRWHRLESYV